MISDCCLHQCSPKYLCTIFYIKIWLHTFSRCYARFEDTKIKINVLSSPPINYVLSYLVFFFLQTFFFVLSIECSLCQSAVQPAPESEGFGVILNQSLHKRERLQVTFGHTGVSEYHGHRLGQCWEWSFEKFVGTVMTYWRPLTKLGKLAALCT